MKKWKIIVSLIILAVLLSIGGYVVWANSRISGAEIVPLEALESEDYISYDSQYILMLSRDEFWIDDKRHKVENIKYTDNIITATIGDNDYHFIVLTEKLLFNNTTKSYYYKN